MKDDDATAHAKRLRWWAAAAVSLFLAGIATAAYAAKSDHRITVLEEVVKAMDWKLDLILEQHGVGCGEGHGK